VKTLAKLLYVEADEEITDLVDRLRDLSLEDEVTFVVPERARALQSAMSFRLLKRYADSYGKRVNLVSGDPRLQAMSLEAGFTAYPNLAAYDRGGEVHRPELPGEPISTGATTIASAAPPVAPAAPPISQAIASQRGVATMDRPRETSVLSAPPKQQAPAARKPAPAGPSLGSYRPYLIGAAVLAVVGLLVGILYLPTATATVFVQGTPIKADVTLLEARVRVEVLALAGREVVHDHDLVPSRDERVDEMRADEPGAPCHDRPQSPHILRRPCL